MWPLFREGSADILEMDADSDCVSLCVCVRVSVLFGPYDNLIAFQMHTHTCKYLVLSRLLKAGCL